MTTEQMTNDNEQSTHDFGNIVGQSDLRKRGYTFKIKKCRNCGCLKMTREDFTKWYSNDSGKTFIREIPECKVSNLSINK